ncbi:MAG: transporter substrate-binding domain-containing protein [Desulfobacterales bacterium]|nr:transporter substrate-binding domain-containing protein [Desulfobacterales bacterium]
MKQICREFDTKRNDILEKYNQMKRILIALLSCLFLLIGIESACAETLKIASIDWCPQLCSGKKYAGYVTDTVKTIFKKSPYELEIKTYPWSRSIYMVRNGDAHALLAPARAEAPDLLYPENKIGIQRMCFFTKAGSEWKYSGIESLKDLQIGIATDSSVEELNSYISQNKRQFQFMPYNNTYVEKSLKKLDKGRFDTFLFTYNTTMYKMRELGKKVRPAGCVSSANIYMAFSPDKSQTARIQRMMKYFDEKMSELKRSGKIGQIMNSYSLEDWQKFE